MQCIYKKSLLLYIFTFNMKTTSKKFNFLKMYLT